MALKDLRKSSASMKERLTKTIKEQSEKKGGKADSRFWEPTVDEAGNGTAIIRFLPPKEGEQDCYVRLYRHAFCSKTTGQWYIENSRTTLGDGENDPVSDYNTELWNTGDEENRKIVREQKRKVQYITNIYVVSDPKNPQNEGKVFLYSLGTKLFDKIKDAMNPPIDDTDPDAEIGEGYNPFDFWEGANFKLVIRKVAGYRNYDKSAFQKQSVLLGGDDDELQKVYEQIYSLKEFIDPSNFKSYDELQKRFYRVIGLPVPGEKRSVLASSAAQSKPTATKATSKPARSVVQTNNDDDDDDDYDKKADASSDDDDESLTEIDELARLIEDDLPY